MNFHLPKPLHGWREFVGEVGITLLGVLIALGAEQMIGAVHNRQVVADARRNLRAEAAIDVGFIRDRLSAQACTLGFKTPAERFEACVAMTD